MADISNVPPIQNITLVRGTTMQPLLTITTPGNPNAPLDLGTVTKILLLLKASITDKDSAAILTKDSTVGGQITIVNAPQGQCQPNFLNSDTDPASNSLTWSQFPEGVAQPYAVKIYPQEEDVLAGTITVVTVAVQS